MHGLETMGYEKLGVHQNVLAHSDNDTDKKIGSWTECINPFRNPVKHYFFRHVPKDPKFTENDKAKVCPLCWTEAKTKNNKMFHGSSRSYAQLIHHSSCTPEKDTL